MKKPIKAIALITAICASMLASCATYQSSANSIPISTPPSTPATSVTSTLPEAYNTVLELMYEGYQSMSLKDFNVAVRAKIEEDSSFLSIYNEFMENLIVLDTEVPSTKKPLTVDDGVYEFINETLNYSINEVISPQIGESISISRYLEIFSGEYTGGANNDETFYDFMFTALYSVEYRAIDETALTIQERDELIQAYHTALQVAVSGMTMERLSDNGCKTEIQKIADNLTNDFSTDTFIFENAEIQSIEILNAGQEYLK